MHVVMVLIKTIANAWTTSHRVHSDPRLPCRFFVHLPEALQWVHLPEDNAWLALPLLLFRLAVSLTGSAYVYQVIENVSGCAPLFLLLGRVGIC